MKEKIIVAAIAIIVVIGAIFTATIIKDEEESLQKQEEPIIVSEKVTDECTEEYEISIRNQEVTEASSSEEKLSANSAMILKKYFVECEHTINEYAEIPPELVNLTQEEIVKYTDHLLAEFYKDCQKQYNKDNRQIDIVLSNGDFSTIVRKYFTKKA